MSALTGVGGNGIWLSLALSFVAFASFSWAIRGHFVTTGRIPNGMRYLSLISLLSYISFVTLVVTRRRDVVPSRAMMPAILTVAGLVLFILSIGVFWWAITTTRRQRLKLAHSDADPSFIYSSGPYAHVRHPFYCAYILFWIGTALVAGGWQWLPAIILTAWYIHVARSEEQRFGHSAVAHGYDAYRQRTGMLLPRLTRRPHPPIAH